MKSRRLVLRWFSFDVVHIFGMIWVDAIFIDVFDEVLLLDDCVEFVYELPFLQDWYDLLD